MLYIYILIYCIHVLLIHYQYSLTATGTSSIQPIKTMNKNTSLTAHKNLIRYAISAGHFLSVHDGEEWSVKRSKKYADILAAIESVEECTIRIRSAAGEKIGSAFVTPFEEAEETVCDYSITPFMEEWNKAYNKRLELKYNH